MSIELDVFERSRPYLFHLTARDNLPRIRRLRLLESAAALANRGGRADVLGTRRRDHIRITVEGEPVMLRDQAPLHLGNMRLEDGWGFERFVRHLNDHVFFWPGGEVGPISYGVRHFGRYESEGPAIIRISVASLRAAYPGLELRFSKCNSGSPRWSRGIAAPRGADTFLPANQAPFVASQVVEVTALHVVRLPDDVRWGPRPSGPWDPLFDEPEKVGA